MATNDQRKAPRKPVALPASVSRTNASFFGNEVVVEMVNMSRTGALVQAKDVLVPGEVCILTLSKPTGGYGDIPARIVWAERRSDGEGYRAGVAFRNLTADEEYLVDLHLLHSAQK